jgi:thiol-disulfide isomerase/thioredoxin
MSEGPKVEQKPKSFLTWALWGAALVGVAAVVYIMAQASTKEAPKAPTSSASEAAPGQLAAKFIRADEARPGPDYAFNDQAGKAMKIADLKGKVVVMNIWATWCAPCKVEMPTLAKLQAAFPNGDVEVVAVSIDAVADADKARLFIAQNGPLKFYHDPEMKMPFQLKPAAAGAPTTVVYGKDGLEIGRVAGEADWSTEEAKALIRTALAS